MYDNRAVASADGHWYRLTITGHNIPSNVWTWGDLNDGHNDLANFRGVVAENPFTITSPSALDWAYIANERRWVRYQSSTWTYQPAPAAFDATHRSQHAAQDAGVTTVGTFIFNNSSHSMRIIRNYQGAVPGAPVFEWTTFQTPALNIEDWALRDQNVRIQPRKLAEFATHDVNQISSGGEQWFTLRARVHKNADGSLTSYDLSHWIEEQPPGGAVSRASLDRFCGRPDRAVSVHLAPYYC